MSRAEARRDQSGGKLEAGLDADFDREVVRVFELIVSDDRHEGAEHFKGAVEIKSWFDRVGCPDLGILTELEGTSAVVTLYVQGINVIIIHVELLPNGADASSYKRTKLHLSWPSQNTINLDRHLNQFPVRRIVKGSSICKSDVVLINSIIGHSRLEPNAQPFVKVISELHI